MKLSIKIFFICCAFMSVSCLKEDDGIIIVPDIEGAEIAPNIGGPGQPHQVWVDLSTGEMKETTRTDWDLGFYTGDEFAVILNTSALMSASPVEGVSDLNEVTSQSVSGLMQVVQVGTFDPENIQYVDDIEGNYLNDGTVIKEENRVYLVNLGYGIYEGPFASGTSYPSGNPRGWKKIKISRDGNSGYTIQYAGLDETQVHEAYIGNNPDHNFTFFSLVNDNVVDIQPEKKNWDLCFTVFVNQVEDTNGNNQGTYVFSDFILTNTMDGTGAYEVVTNESTLLEDFSNFSGADVDEQSFIYDDHRAIGDHWRIIPGAIVRKDRFYVLKDPNGVLFKIRFISMTQPDENDPQLILRGYPVFEYEPL